MEFSTEHVIVYMGLLALLSTGAFSQDKPRVTSRCETSEAYTGDPASVTCHYNEDLSKPGKPFRLYHYDKTNETEKTVVDCYWQVEGSLKCTIAPGYNFDKNVSSQLTVTIISTSASYVGRYECSTEPISASDRTPCYLKIKEGITTVLPRPNNNKESDSDPIVPIVIPVVVLLLAAVCAAAVLVYLRKRRTKSKENIEEEACHNATTTALLSDPDKDHPAETADIHSEDETTARTAENQRNEVKQDGHDAQVMCPIRQKDCHLLILGQTGSGKSTLGNMLLGSEFFKTAVGIVPETTQTQVGKAKEGHLEVMDTPDISNTDLTKAAPEKEVSKWKQFMSQSSGAILLTVRCDENYSAHDYRVYQQMKDLWGDSSSFCQRLFVAFTFGEKPTSEASAELKKILHDASDRHAFFNENSSPRVKEQAFSTLLSFVDRPEQGESAPGAYDVANGAAIPHGAKHILLLIGKTGNGRSSVGNMLLGRREIFETGCGMSSTTTDAQAEETNTFKIVDTPDISDSDHFTGKQRKEQLSKWKQLASPGPHAILLTVRCDVRYTAEEYDIYKQLKTLWGDAESFCRRLVVAFTFGDRQDGSIEEELKGSIPQELKNVLGDAGHRYVVFNNRAKPDDNKEAVNKLADIVWTIRQQNETERCLIVVGKTGNGRSSVGNTLLGKDEFQTGCGMSSTTTEPKAATSDQLPKIKVVDTPDISDNDHFTDKQRKDQLSKWKRLAAPGPHAILLTVRCDVRYTAEEYDIYKQLKTLWGDSFCKLLIVAFTFGDRQDADIEEELKSSVPVELNNVLKDASGRYVVFNNRAEPGEKFKTVNRLLDIVDKLSKTRSATGPRSRP